MSLDRLFLLFIPLLLGIGDVEGVECMTWMESEAVEVVSAKANRACSYTLHNGAFVIGKQTALQKACKEHVDTTADGREETRCCKTDLCNGLSAFQTAATMRCQDEEVKGAVTGRERTSNGELVYQPCLACLYGLNEGGEYVSGSSRCWDRLGSLQSMPSQVQRFVFCARTDAVCNADCQSVSGTACKDPDHPLTCWQGDQDNLKTATDCDYCYSYTKGRNTHFTCGRAKNGKGEEGCADPALNEYPKTPYPDLSCCNNKNGCNARHSMCYHDLIDWDYDFYQTNISLRGNCDYCLKQQEQPPSRRRACLRGKDANVCKTDPAKCCKGDWCNGDGDINCWWGLNRARILVSNCALCRRVHDKKSNTYLFKCPFIGRKNCRSRISFNQDRTVNTTCCQENSCNWIPLDTREQNNPPQEQEAPLNPQHDHQIPSQEDDNLRNQPQQNLGPNQGPPYDQEQAIQQQQLGPNQGPPYNQEQAIQQQQLGPNQGPPYNQEQDYQQQQAIQQQRGVQQPEQYNGNDPSYQENGANYAPRELNGPRQEPMDGAPRQVVPQQGGGGMETGGNVGYYPEDLDEPFLVPQVLGLNFPAATDDVSPIHSQPLFLTLIPTLVFFLLVPIILPN